jgi:predicted nuclease with TOPRIM domain
MKSDLMTIYTIGNSRVTDKLNELNISAKEKWELLEFVELVQDKYTKVEKARQDLIKKYGTAVGENTQVMPDKFEEFSHEFSELGETEVEVPDIKLPLSKLDSLSLSQMSALRLFIDKEA